MSKRPNVADAMKNLRPKNLKDAFEGKEKRSRKQEPGADSKYTAEEKAQMDAEGKGLSGVTKSWKERFNQINDTEFWLCFCFDSDSDRDTFISRSVLAEVEQVRPQVFRGEDVALKMGLDVEEAAPAKFDKSKLLRMTPTDIKFRQRYRAHPYPLEGKAVTTDDMEADLARDVNNLAEAIRQGQDPSWAEKYANALDRPHYFLMFFQNAENKDSFIAHTYLAQIGNKYIDGNKAAIIMDVEMGAIG